MTTDEMGSILKFMAAVTNREMKPASMVAYSEMLIDLPFQPTKQAVKNLVASDSRFIPAVSDIRRAVLDLVKGPQLTSGQAWEEVLKAASTIGRDGKPKWSSEAIAKAVKSIGWRQICLSEAIHFERAQFIREYEEFARRETQENLSLGSGALSLGDGTSRKFGVIPGGR